VSACDATCQIVRTCWSSLVVVWLAVLSDPRRFGEDSEKQSPGMIRSRGSGTDRGGAGGLGNSPSGTANAGRAGAVPRGWTKDTSAEAFGEGRNHQAR
jgi:hypothetical protein